MVVQACNPSYSGSRDREDHNSKITNIKRPSNTTKKEKKIAKTLSSRLDQMKDTISGFKDKVDVFHANEDRGEKNKEV
jgi:predicted RNase H-like nuclease (RuvC/YqgF family)